MRLATPCLLLALLSLALTACDDDPLTAPDAAGTDAAFDARPPLDAAPDALPLDALPADAAPDALPLDADQRDAVPGDRGVADAFVDHYPLRINELMAKNEGTAVDEFGEVADWIELINIGDSLLNLEGARIDDSLHGPGHPLPGRLLAPGEVIVLWADGQVDQGPWHLPFKLSSEGEDVALWAPDGVMVDHVEMPSLRENEVYARQPDGTGDFVTCDWATPRRANGDQCGPPPPPDIEDEVYAEYDWPEPWPAVPMPLILTELALRPAQFVEVLNVSDAPVALADFQVRLAAQGPGEPWPAREVGAALAWPVERLGPGERVAVSVVAVSFKKLTTDPSFEGVAQLWQTGVADPIDRVDFMAWPEGAALTRVPDTGRHQFCAALTPGAPNDNCDPLPSRPVDAIVGRLRHLRTPGDFAALAEGGVQVGVESVKVVVDLEAGDVTHLLGSRRWDLHYTFVRELIDGDPHLDRCDPNENAFFNAGWRAFSEVNYLQVEGRRYLLGTLEHHGGADLYTLEFAAGDVISPEQIRHAFFVAMQHVIDPLRYAFRPVTGQHQAHARTLEGTLPIVGPNAPFIGQSYQPLTQTVGYGVLTFVPVHELDSAPLGPQSLVVTDQVPNDIALVGGLITESFQTPLAHVNLLSRNRDTPNMALTGARDDPRIAPFFGELVRLDVRAGTFELRVADPAEAAAFWQARRPQGPPLRPRLDESVRGVVPLAGRGLEDLPAVGAKAAGLAELGNVVSQREFCPGHIARPA
ncbi:MAG: lamin tail domain-containing protein, partial [Myxococcales bacterium]|nr:lamin tail domain-containing protein [Myxococcales bacterium]